MTSVYILYFRRPKTTYYFTSVIAIYERFTAEELHIKYKSLNTHSFKKGPYENMFITITKVKAYGKGDYQKELEEQENIKE